MAPPDILESLYAVLSERKKQDPTQSYVASLHRKGRDKILEKIGEECTEVIIAAKNDYHPELVKELADLWFHCLILLSHENIPPHEIMAELERRFGISGLEEKRSRSSEPSNQ